MNNKGVVSTYKWLNTVNYMQNDRYATEKAKKCCQK